MSINVMDRRGMKIHEKHEERILGFFKLNGEIFNIVNTKHGLYRVLEKKNMNTSIVGDIIMAIGMDDLQKHFEIAMTYYNAKASWERQVDYVLSIYDVTHDIVFMIGLHPHLNRITIVTVIPRVMNVKSNDIYGAYRMDSNATKHINIGEVLPNRINLIHRRLINKNGE